jgi:hypothetical protein
MATLRLRCHYSAEKSPLKSPDRFIQGTDYYLGPQQVPLLIVVTQLVCLPLRASKIPVISVISSRPRKKEYTHQWGPCEGRTSDVDSSGSDRWLSSLFAEPTIHCLSCISVMDTDINSGLAGHLASGYLIQHHPHAFAHNHRPRVCLTMRSP